MLVKKIVAYLAVLTGTTALVLATSRTLSEQIENCRSYALNHDLWWGQQRGKWGDLTSMSYLDQVNKFCEPKSYDFKDLSNEGEKNIDLYLYGDSYVTEIPKGAFPCLDSFIFHFRYDTHEYTLNPAKRNILIIEASERFVRERFRTTGMLSNLKIDGYYDPLHPLEKKKPKATAITPSGFATLFNPHINQNLEYHLFNYNFLIYPRQLKAALNFELFNRASGDVAISDDGKYLFYKMTLAQGNICSSYDRLAEKEVKTIVASLDTIYDHYKQAGFAEVYFSVIPNPVSILQPGWYNNLIPLIQNDPELKVPFIDVYSLFKQHQQPASLYRAGDTHWNNNGAQIWLQLVNEMLRKESEKQK